MAKEITPERVNTEYQKGVEFNLGIDLYECVDVNENFFVGKQWEGVKSNGLPTPVFNFLKRVVLFSVANVTTDNLKLNATPLPSSGEVPPESVEAFSSILNDQYAAIFEHNRMGGLIREFCRNAAVDGDGCMYTYWDAEAPTGQPSKGAIKTEILPNTQVMFGNPNCRDVQSQPYIIVERRMLVEEARKYAEAHGVSKADAESICADEKEAGNIEMDALGGGKVTVLLRMWKKDGIVHCYESTRKQEIRKEWSLGVPLYPITWMPWDYLQDCYHGQAMITGLIPNQIFVNKLFAMSMISLMTLAYPKVVYDKTRVAKWSAKVGTAIGVNGNVDGVAKIIDPASISPQISQFIEVAIGYTQRFLGATDVALGDTRPDNTSAIIALQRASAIPAELTRRNLMQQIEELGRIYNAFMAEYYGERYVEMRIPGSTEKAVIKFDFAALKDIPCSIDLDAGASAYWSEIASMQTLDNLLMAGRISTSEYLRRLPAGQISDREALIAVTEAAEQQAQQAQMAAAMPPEGAPAPEGGEEIPVRGGRGYGELQRKINESGELPREVM